MTDTLTLRVAEAIYLSWMEDIEQDWSACEDKEFFVKAAKAAIEASGAQHLQGLVEALKEIATGKNRDGEKVDFFQDIAKEVLAALPEEVRGEKCAHRFVKASNALDERSGVVCADCGEKIDNMTVKVGGTK